MVIPLYGDPHTSHNFVTGTSDNLSSPMVFVGFMLLNLSSWRNILSTKVCIVCLSTNYDF